MALQKKYPCPYHNQFMPDYLEHPEWCPTCHGTLFWDGDVYLDGYKGRFKNIDYKTIGTADEDMSLRVRCACGEELFLSDTEPKVCDCGRIYKLGWSVKVDESHIGELDWLINESNRLADEHRARFSS